MKFGVSATGHSRDLRTVIVDDSALARLLLRDALSFIPGVRVVGNASERQAAIEVVDAVAPDLVTLDLDMPGESVLELLKELKQRHPSIAVLVCGRQNGPAIPFFAQAMALGALGVIETPISRNRDENVRQLRMKIAEIVSPMVHQVRHGSSPSSDVLKSTATGVSPVVQEASKSVVSSSKHTVAISHGIAPKFDFEAEKIGLVLVGASTGGPAALRTLLSGLRANLQVPVCIVQHIPPGFSKPLAQRLSTICSLPVTEAMEGLTMHPGSVYLAPGGHHLLIDGSASEPILRLDDGELENGCRPAIDVTLRSALNVFGARTLVVILTGMGRDGATGAGEIRRIGGKVFVQMPESCTVSSMPRQTLETSGADAVGELSELSQWINEAVQ